jgi:hypothetical protein
MEELIRNYYEMMRQIGELEEKKRELGALILQQMQTKSMRVADYIVRKYSRLSIKLTIEEARAFDAIKMEETVDKDKIKALYHLGQPVKGVSEVEYLRVSNDPR